MQVIARYNHIYGCLNSYVVPKLRATSSYMCIRHPAYLFQANYYFHLFIQPQQFYPFLSLLHILESNMHLNPNSFLPSSLPSLWMYLLILFAFFVIITPFKPCRSLWLLHLYYGHTWLANYISWCIFSYYFIIT